MQGLADNVLPAAPGFQASVQQTLQSYLDKN